MLCVKFPQVQYIYLSAIVYIVWDESCRHCDSFKLKLKKAFCSQSLFESAKVFPK